MGLVVENGTVTVLNLLGFTLTFTPMGLYMGPDVDGFFRRVGGSRLRGIVYSNTAKAGLWGVGVSASRLSRVFKLNAWYTRRVLEELVDRGLAVKVKRGNYALAGTEKALKWRDWILGELLEFYRSSPTAYPPLFTKLPETAYYVSKPYIYIQTWFGLPQGQLTFIDITLKGKPVLEGITWVDLSEYREATLTTPVTIPVFVNLRGREWRWDDRWGSVASEDQAVADILSYDPLYPIEADILLNFNKLNLDGIARRCTVNGLKRLSNILAFMETWLGLDVRTGIDFYKLLDRELFKQQLPILLSYGFANEALWRLNI